MAAAPKGATDMRLSSQILRRFDRLAGEADDAGRGNVIESGDGGDGNAFRYRFCERAKIRKSEFALLVPTVLIESAAPCRVR